MSSFTEHLHHANLFCRTLLLHSRVVSYGIRNLCPFMEFRDGDGENSYLTAQDTHISFVPNRPLLGLSPDEQMLLHLHQLQGQKVVDVRCSADSDLYLTFENGTVLQVHGESPDAVSLEPWLLGKGHQLLITKIGGSYSF